MDINECLLQCLNGDQIAISEQLHVTYHWDYLSLDALHLGSKCGYKL